MGKPNFIYLGPSIPSVGIKRNAIFRSEELPFQLKEIALAKPVIKALYVSTKDLAETKKRITRKGSLEYTANQELLAIAKKQHASQSLSGV